MLVYWAYLRSAPTYKNHATAPELQPPVCCFLPAMLHELGSWLIPTRRLPNGYVTERSWGGKWEMVAF